MTVTTDSVVEFSNTTPPGYVFTALRFGFDLPELASSELRIDAIDRYGVDVDCSELFGKELDAVVRALFRDRLLEIPYVIIRYKLRELWVIHRPLPDRINGFGGGYLLRELVVEALKSMELKAENNHWQNT